MMYLSLFDGHQTICTQPCLLVFCDFLHIFLLIILRFGWTSGEISTKTQSTNL